MPLTLFLLRHAKSSWKHPALHDHARPLNARGRRAAPAIGAFLRDTGFHPDLILCSSAQRTRETLSLILPFLNGSLDCRIDDTLYEAHSADALMDRIRTAPDQRRAVMLIGHNPAIGDLALALCSPNTDPNQRAMMEEKYPTCGLSVFESECAAWPLLQEGEATLKIFITPRDLQKGEETNLSANISPPR